MMYRSRMETKNTKKNDPKFLFPKGFNAFYAGFSVIVKGFLGHTSFNRFAESRPIPSKQ